MNNKVIVSAPGKLMLLGEHAVVYGRPCLVTAVDQRMRVKAEIIDTKEFHLEAPGVKISNYKKSLNEIGEGDIPKGAKFVEVAIKNVIEYARKTNVIARSKATKQSRTDQENVNPETNGIASLFSFFKARKDVVNKNGLRITTSSKFSSEFGFGSSSASTVCTVKALSELFDLKLPQRELFDISYKTVLDVQGKGSGFDIAAGVFGGTIYFVKGGEIIEPIDIKDFKLIIGYSGIKADTVAVVNQVKAKADKYPEIIETLYNSIEDSVLFAKKALSESDWQSFGELMNINQGYLEALGVSSSKLSAMISAARDAGSYGAKLSGAGIGDCMIAIAPDEKRKAVENAITKAGGEIIKVKTNAVGVRIEK